MPEVIIFFEIGGVVGVPGVSGRLDISACSSSGSVARSLMLAGQILLFPRNCPTPLNVLAREQMYSVLIKTLGLSSSAMLQDCFGSILIQ